VIKVMLAELSDADIRPPQLRLHDIRVDLAKPARQLAFYFNEIGAGQVKV